jgi:hypothetical protein
MRLMSRYFADYLLSMFAWFAAWAASMWFMDGIIVWIVFVIMIVWAVSYIPYMIRQDYLKIKSFVMDIKNFKNGNMSKHQFITNTIKLACDETGIPEEIVLIFMKKENINVPVVI